MNRRAVISIIAGVVVVFTAAWALTVGLERVMRPRSDGEASAAPTAQPPRPAAPERHITATIFYASPDAQRLVPVKREVPFGEGPIEQGRQIVNAQLTMPAPASTIGVVPQGAVLRSFYVTEKGDAFVDLGPEIAAGHPGGSAAELLTVYAIVNAVAVNLPAVQRVQILIDGKEADTLAGHVDLRRPLRRNDAIIGDDSKR